MFFVRCNTKRETTLFNQRHCEKLPPDLLVVFCVQENTASKSRIDTDFYNKNITDFEIEGSYFNDIFKWSARRDSNPRPSESESAAISSFATGGYNTLKCYQYL